jgi:hypothetical protein
VRNLISSLEKDLLSISAVSAAAIGYFFIILKGVNADIPEFAEDDKANVAFSSYKVAYAIPATALLFYFSVIFSDDLVLFLVVASALWIVTTYSKGKVEHIKKKSEDIPVILSFLIFVFSSLVFIAWMFTLPISMFLHQAQKVVGDMSVRNFSSSFIFWTFILMVSVVWYPAQVSVHELISFVLILLVVQYAEQRSIKRYRKKTSDYSFAERQIDNDSSIENLRETDDLSNIDIEALTEDLVDNIIEDQASEEVVVLLLLVLVILVYIVNFSAIIAIYVLVSTPAVMMFIKFWSYPPKKYDVETKDGSIEDVFIPQEKYSQGYITLLTEEGKKRVLLHDVTEIKPKDDT